MNPLWKKDPFVLKLLSGVYENTISLVKKIARELKDKRNWLIFAVVYLFMTSPTWVGWLLYFITGNPWHLTYSTAYMAFWALPLTPLIPLCIAITLFIRKILRMVR